MATSEKAELMRSMNHEIALLAADSAPLAGDRWSFLCECDAADCRECVELELAEYREISADPYAAVLAASHAAVSRSQRARREAERAIDSSRALRAQAELQQIRAERLLAGARNVVMAVTGPEIAAEPHLTRMLDVLEEERNTLERLACDDRVADVLIEMDDLELVIVRALAGFEPQPGTRL